MVIKAWFGLKVMVARWLAVDCLCLRTLGAVGVGWLANDSYTLSGFAFEIS